MKTALENLGFKYTCLIIASVSFLNCFSGMFFYSPENANDTPVPQGVDVTQNCEDNSENMTQSVNGIYSLELQMSDCVSEEYSPTCQHTTDSSYDVESTQTSPMKLKNNVGANKIGNYNKAFVCDDGTIANPENDMNENQPSLQNIMVTDKSMFPTNDVISNDEMGHCVEHSVSAPQEDLKATNDHQEKIIVSTDQMLGCAARTKKLCVCYSLHVLRNPTYLAVLFSLTGYAISRSISNGYEVALTTEIGIPANDIALMLTIIAASGVVTNPIAGALLSISALKPYVKYIYAAASILNGITILLYGFTNSFAALLALGVIKRALKNVIAGQITGILADLFGVENLLEYRAVASVFEGFASLTGPIIAGKIYCEHNL